MGHPLKKVKFEAPLAPWMKNLDISELQKKRGKLRIPPNTTEDWGDFKKYRISSNKRRASNKRRPLISAEPLGIHTEISASPLISAATLNTVLIKLVAIFC